MSSFFNPIKILNVIWHKELPYSAADGSLYCLAPEQQMQIEKAYLDSLGIPTRWQQLSQKKDAHYIIADTHFKAGLTFLLSWNYWLQHAPKSASLYYLCCDEQPLQKADLAKILTYFPQFKQQAAHLLTQYPILTPGFHCLRFEEGRVNLILMLGDVFSCLQQLLICGEKNLERQLRTYAIDAWLLKQPQLTSSGKEKELFNTIALLSKPRTHIVCVDPTCLVETSLREVGFISAKTIEYKNGNCILKAKFRRAINHVKGKTTPWHMPLLNLTENKKVTVIGGGLAGCFLAYFLAKRGQEVILLDNHPRVGNGASGNRQAILYPQLSAFSSPAANFMLTAYLYAHRFYRKLLITEPIGDLSGIIQLAYTAEEHKAITKINDNLLAYYPELGKLLTAKEVSSYANLELECGGLFLPLSGWIDSQALCAILINHPNIQHVANYQVDSLYYDQKLWHCGDYQSEIVVLANGYQANQFPEASFLPIQPTFGQLTFVKTNEELAQLRIPLCGSGHILPKRNNKHAIGATYYPNKLKIDSVQADHLLNLAKLSKLLPDLNEPMTVCGSWHGIRAATPDYLPIVGPLPDKLNFKKCFARLAKDPKRCLPLTGGYYPGIYLFTGFGSRGLTSIPLCADWLSALITNQPTFLPYSSIRALSPARFLLKEMMKQGVIS